MRALITFCTLILPTFVLIQIMSYNPAHRMDDILASEPVIQVVKTVIRTEIDKPDTRAEDPIKQDENVVDPPITKSKTKMAYLDPKYAPPPVFNLDGCIMGSHRIKDGSCQFEGH